MAIQEDGSAPAAVQNGTPINEPILLADGISDYNTQKLYEPNYITNITANRPELPNLGMILQFLRILYNFGRKFYDFFIIPCNFRIFTTENRLQIDAMSPVQNK